MRAPTDRQSNLAEAQQLFGLQRFKDSAQLCRALLARDPDDGPAHELLGLNLVRLGELGRADEHFRVAAARDRSGKTLLNWAAALSAAGRMVESARILDEGFRRFGPSAALHYQRAVNQQALADYRAAAASYMDCIRLEPHFAEAHNNRGTVLMRLGTFEAALECFRTALQVRPNYIRALCNLGDALTKTGRSAAALEVLRQAIDLSPTHPAALCNLGQAWLAQRNSQEAAHCFRELLRRHDGFVEAHVGLASALAMAGDFDGAMQSLDRALALSPAFRHLRGLRLHAGMQAANWRDYDAHLEALHNELNDASNAVSPFVALTVLEAPAILLRLARECTLHEYPPSDELGRIEGVRAEGRIRVGYFSADFRDHPVSRLLVEVLESHDKERFEVSGFGWGGPGSGPLNERVRGAFEHFIDVQERSDLEVAKLARQLGLDVAVDLGGFTQGCRPRIFALRAAPVQVSYLGYLGTLGAPYMDYLLADETLIPESQRQHYQEKIVYLPSYQANDSKREISSRHFTREELGLPPEGFVYCCFNASYKITPKMFDSWMRIVSAVEGSVLYLYASDAQVEQRLKVEAQRRGVAGERLVFGPTLPVPEYLARYRAADLFLDTLPYNAGTTASDALWAGLPVLTCLGESFAGRMAGSLLHALELPELITEGLSSYEARAIELARDPQQLLTICEKLKRQRSTARLFDTQRFTRALEQAFTLMHSRSREGLPTDHLHVASRAS